MERERFLVSKRGVWLFIPLMLLILRDFMSVVLGKYEYSINGWEFLRYTGSVIRAIIIVSLFFLILYVFKYCRIKKLPQGTRFSMYTVAIITVFWTIHSLVTVPGYSITTLDGTAKTICLMMLGVLMGFDYESWILVKKYIPIISFIYIATSAAYVVSVRFGVIHGGITNQNPYWILYSAGFWVFAYYLLCYPNKKVLFTFSLMALNFVVVSFTISRGWLIQTLFLYIVFFLKDNTFSKDRKKVFILLFAVMLGIGTYLLRDQLASAYSSYLLKFSSLSSRTNQFESFFSQVSIKDLIFGLGEYASYSYKGNSEYIYVDNSYLYYAFHFGILFSAILLFLPIINGVGAIRSASLDRKVGIVLLMWVAALSGFSVFCAGYEISFRLLFIMILIGRSVYIRFSPDNDDYVTTE